MKKEDHEPCQSTRIVALHALKSLLSVTYVSENFYGNPTKEESKDCVVQESKKQDSN
jgi:hypothetical protein